MPTALAILLQFFWVGSTASVLIVIITLSERTAYPGDGRLQLICRGWGI
jgi:hypothetical protein